MSSFILWVLSYHFKHISGNKLRFVANYPCFTFRWSVLNYEEKCLWKHVGLSRATLEFQVKVFILILVQSQVKVLNRSKLCAKILCFQQYFQLDLSQTDLTCPNLTWPDFIWHALNCLALYWLDLTRPDLTWSVWAWFDLSLLDLSWLDLPWLNLF